MHSDGPASSSEIRMSGSEFKLDDQDQDHPIVPRAHEWEIVGLCLDLEPVDGSEAFLDLTIRRATARRTLRFWSPQDLEVERGGPSFTGGLVIEDVSARGWEGIGVRVSDFEASHGSVHFVARIVEELTDPER
jgi:hypothetical protein